MVGDWNVCPLDDDVFDVTQFKNSTHVTPAERAAFFALVEDGWVDTVKPHDPSYTYWDYYRQRFEARPRPPHRLPCSVSPSLAARVTGAFVDRDERDPAQGTGSPLRPRAGGPGPHLIPAAVRFRSLRLSPASVGVVTRAGDHWARGATGLRPAGRRGGDGPRVSARSPGLGMVRWSRCRHLPGRPRHAGPERRRAGFPDRFDLTWLV